MSYRYLKRQRLTKADEFSSVFSLRKVLHTQYVQIFMRPNGCHRARMGLVVAKRIAKQAVKRNYMKRVIREYFRLHAPIVSGFDLVVRVKRSFGQQENAVVQKALTELWSKINQCPVS